MISPRSGTIVLLLLATVAFPACVSVPGLQSPDDQVSAVPVREMTLKASDLPAGFSDQGGYVLPKSSSQTKNGYEVLFLKGTTENNRMILHQKILFGNHGDLVRELANLSASEEAELFYGHMFSRLPDPRIGNSSIAFRSQRSPADPPDQKVFVILFVKKDVVEQISYQGWGDPDFEVLRALATTAYSRIR